MESSRDRILKAVRHEQPDVVPVNVSNIYDTAEAIRDYRTYLIETIEQIYLLFQDKFEKHWQQDPREITTGIPGFRQDFFRALFEDMIGYAAAVMIRRMHGLAHNIDVDEIEDLEVRKNVQVMILELAEELMMNRGSLTEIRELTGFVSRSIRAKPD